MADIVYLMDADSPRADFTGQLLIAMPGMGDPRFDQAVVYLCAHSEEGAMGLIVNKPTQDVTLTSLLDQLDIVPKADTAQMPVHFGGPVEQTRGFVLHSLDYRGNSSTLQVQKTYGMTATLDVLEDIAGGRGPGQGLLALGYSGWGPGQLEDELANNAWLTAPAREDILFGEENAQKWQAALSVLGVNALLLSETAGRA